MERKEESACVCTSRGCVVSELLLVLSGFVSERGSERGRGRARCRDNWDCFPGYSAVRPGGAEGKRRQRLGAKYQMLTRNVGGATGVLSLCELNLDVCLALVSTDGAKEMTAVKF